METKLMKFGFTFLCIFLMGVSTLPAQDGAEDIKIFGSLQTMLFNQKYQEKNMTMFDSLNKSFNFESNSFSVQQMDLFLSKQVSEDFQAFVDLEFKLNFSSEKNWGSMNLQEAWVNYSGEDLFNVKVGMLFPKFNGFNEFKNKLALQPYILRPIVYEQSLSKAIYQNEYVPDRAYVQVSGFYPIKNLRVDYAAYIGNSSNENISTNQYQMGPFSGTDSKQFNAKLIGLRLGLQKDDETFKSGISFTKDMVDRSRDSSMLGRKELTRFRLGMDLSFKFDNFEFDGEIINVFYDYNVKKNVSELAEMGSIYYSGSLLYNFTDKLFVYGMYGKHHFSFLFNDEESETYSGGCGYRFNPAVTVKGQFVRYDWSAESKDHNKMPINQRPWKNNFIYDFIGLALSVLF